jgi:hypothetical protein
MLFSIDDDVWVRLKILQASFFGVVALIRCCFGGIDEKENL